MSSLGKVANVTVDDVKRAIREADQKKVQTLSKLEAEYKKKRAAIFQQHRDETRRLKKLLAAMDDNEIPIFVSATEDSKASTGTPQGQDA